MKFNFKKVASVLAATIMLGSTVSFAAAAWPAPFVSSGSSASAVVYGANAPSTGGDKAAAINLGAELDKSITSTVSTSTSTTGDAKKIEKTNDKFNLGDAMNTFYSTLDNEEMTKVLANGVYTNDNNDEYKYEQSIALNALTLTHFADTDFNDDKPVLGFQLNNDNQILNYTLEFTPDSAEGGAALVNLETTNLEMLGMTYYIVSADSTSNGIKLTLLDNANEATVADGEEKTVTVGDNSYNVKIAFVDSANTILEVNGVKTNKLATGDVFKVGKDTYVAVKNVLYNSKESGISQVEFSIGSGKIVLENNQEVQLNGEAISDTDSFNGNVLNTYITNTTTNIETIKLQWSLDDDAWLAPGTDLVLPGFKTIKFSMSEFNAPKAEKTTLKADGDTIFTVSTELTDGAITLPILYTDDDQTKFSGLGEKATKVLVTSKDNDQSVALSLNKTQNSYFVASWVDGDNYESSAFQIDTITDNDGKNSTVLKNLAGGSDISFSKVGDTKDKGSVTFTLTAANKDSKTATVTLSCASPGVIYTNKVVTKEGLALNLPVINVTSVSDGDGSININATSTVTAWTMNFTEEDATNGDIMGGNSFTATIDATNSDGPEATSLSATAGSSMETSDGSKVYETIVVSDMATKTLFDRPSSGLNTLEVIYAGEESTASVYIAEASAAVGAVKDSVKVVTDAEVDSVKSKNLIVVGGSCINTVAASMLGSTSPVCGDSWASQTGTGPGKYLIQVAASPVNAEKIAMLIAGYEAADTTNAVAKVKEGAVSTDVGTKLVGPVAA